MGRTEGSSGGSEPDGFPIVVYHSHRGYLSRAGYAIAPGARRQSRGVAHRPVVRRKRAGALQPGPARDRRARLRCLLVRNIPPVPARGRGPVFPEAPIVDRPVVTLAVIRVGATEQNGKNGSLANFGAAEVDRGRTLDQRV